MKLSSQIRRACTLGRLASNASAPDSFSEAKSSRNLVKSCDDVSSSPRATDFVIDLVSRC